jgi:UDPglucose 6-dehydrogenase
MFMEAGFTVRAHDPEARQSAAAVLGKGVAMIENRDEALQGADALIIFTDWQEFRTPDFDMMAANLRQKLIFDGRNLYDPQAMAKRGFQYICIGRPALPTN